MTDRIKDVIKSGGEWISSIDMENAIVGHPKVVEAAVSVSTIRNGRNDPVALVVTVDGAELPIEEVHDLLSASFAKWQLPEKVLYVDRLPRRASASWTRK